MCYKQGFHLTAALARQSTLSFWGIGAGFAHLDEG